MSVVYSEFSSKTPTKKVDRLSNSDLESPPVPRIRPYLNRILDPHHHSRGHFRGSHPSILSRALLLHAFVLLLSLEVLLFETVE